MNLPSVAAPHPMPTPGPGAAPGGIAGTLRRVAAAHGAHGAAGQGVHPPGSPINLTQRGNPVSPYGHEPAAPPVPAMRPRPPMVPQGGGAY